MDLGIQGKWALVCAASRGLGKACATSLATEGANLVITARGRDALRTTAEELRKLAPQVEVRDVACDITTEEGRTDALRACPQVDILITNAGGPPPGKFQAWERSDWLQALEANMLAPLALIRAVVYEMMERQFGRIVNITSAAVKSAGPDSGLTAGARAGFTAAIAGLARTSIAHNVTINNLLPNGIETERLTVLAQPIAEQRGVSVEEVLAERARRSPAGRFGQPEEFGAACAFLCSAQAGYITGQNILIDGGAYPGNF